jgi:ABC-type enterobactin transport system permease subunit
MTTSGRLPHKRVTELGRIARALGFLRLALLAAASLCLAGALFLSVFMDRLGIPDRIGFLVMSGYVVCMFLFLMSLPRTELPTPNESGQTPADEPSSTSGASEEVDSDT